MLPGDWQETLWGETHQPYFRRLMWQLLGEYSEHTIFPRWADVFRALELTSYADTKVVILGQDPYHTPGHANGLAFSTDSKDLPPSLCNIFTELYNDVGVAAKDGDLSPWAGQGVLLLNTALTVRAHSPGSHSHMLEWGEFTRAVLQALMHRPNPPVFVLWGKHARQVFDKAREGKSMPALYSSHPSPFSADYGPEKFKGSRPFSRVNQILDSRGDKPIDWSL